MSDLVYGGFPRLSEEDYNLSFRHPAMQSRGRFYLIQDNKIVGRVKMGSAMGMANGLYSHVCVEPDDEAAELFFQDDFSLAAFGMILGLRYDGITGRPLRNFDDETEDRHKKTEIVDSMDFDFGIAHPRFKSVEGWANVINKPKPRVHSHHNHRRPRCSNKIRKVA